VKRTFRTLLVLVLGLSLLAAACGSDNKDTASGGSTATSAKTTAKKPSVTIGAQDFGESAILAEIYKQGLAAKGFTTSVQTLGGYRAIELEAFSKGTINFAPEYAASMLEELNGKEKSEATGNLGETVGFLKPYLDTKKLVALKASDAVDTNAFVLTKATSDRLGIKTLSELATKGKDLKLGAPADCQTNPFCLAGLKRVYGLDLSAKLVSLEAAAVAPALDANTIDVGLLFSTDSRIKSKGYVLLTDDKKLLAADNIVPVVTTELAGNADLVKAADAISAKLTTEGLIDLNKRYDVDKEDAAVIAKSFLQDNKLL
jgi:osmoprotectant transport system substrate-binding protein